MVFALHAERYWDAGLPVIPLYPNQKRPAVNAWQKYSHELPNADVRRVWLANYGDGNIGMPLGPQSGLLAVDIDTEDPAALKIIDAILPKTPWRRVGKKGEVRIYKFDGQRTTRLTTPVDGMIIEFLSTGTQIVLPPSIHPDTMAPYRSNCDLVDVLSTVPKLPIGVVDLMRDMLKDAGFDVSAGGTGKKLVDFVPAGARDNAMVYHAGLLARAVTRGERSLIEALGEITVWCERYVENVVGDPLDPLKAQGKVVEFLVRDVTGVLQKPLPQGWDTDLTDEMKVELGLDFSEDVEVWSTAKLIEWLTQEMSELTEIGGDAQTLVITKALARMSRMGSALSSLDQERLLKMMSMQSRGMFTVAALRKELKEINKGDILGEDHNEVARAVHAHLNDFGEVRFHAGRFWQWKGSHWEIKPEGEIVRVVSEEFGNFPTCKRQTDYVAIVRLLRDKAAKDLVNVTFRGINFANGFLTEDLDLIDHQPDFGQTYVLPFRYLPEMAGKMPLFNEFMHTSWGHDDDYDQKMMGIQEAIGATLFSVTTRYQRAICLFGQAGSGKSTMSKIVRSMLPAESMSAVPPQDWNDRFLPAEMFGKLLNFAGELSETRTIPGEIFKQVVEGESLTGQFKQQQPFQFKPLCAQWFLSNHLPKTSDSSDGFNRRWLFLEWSRPVPMAKRIPDYDRLIVEEEREAIVAWAVQGFQRLKKQGDYTLSGSHRLLTDQMATDNNSVRYFLAASPRLSFAEGKQSSVTDLYAEYLSFCLTTGVVRRASSSSFLKMTRELQHSFAFKMETTKGPNGGIEVSFHGVTIAR